MLSIILSKNESIVVDDGIIVTVLGVSGDTVRLSIERPEGVSVERGEMCELVAAADKTEFSS